MRIFKFKGLHNCDSECSLAFIPHPTLELFVVLTELGNNPGTSITNACESIATQVYHLHLKELSPTDIRWIEHYNEKSYKSKKDKREKSFDEVTLTWERNRFTSPRWHPCDAAISEIYQSPAKNRDEKSRIINKSN